MKTIRYALAAGLALSLSASTNHAHGGGRTTDAESTLGFAISYCVAFPEDGHNVSPNVVPSSVEHTKREAETAFKQYRDARARAVAADANVLASTKDYKARVNQTRTYAEWVRSCDARLPMQVAALDTALAAAKKRESEQVEKQKKATEESNQIKQKWASKMTGARKRLYEERGWPSDSAGGDAFAKIVKAAWWMYGSELDPSTNKFLCRETISFSKDRIKSHKTEGLCR